MEETDPTGGMREEASAVLFDTVDARANEMKMFTDVETGDLYATHDDVDAYVRLRARTEGLNAERVATEDVDEENLTGI